MRLQEARSLTLFTLELRLSIVLCEGLRMTGRLMRDRSAVPRDSLSLSPLRTSAINLTGSRMLCDLEILFRDMSVDSFMLCDRTMTLFSFWAGTDLLARRTELIASGSPTHRSSTVLAGLMDLGLQLHMLMDSDLQRLEEDMNWLPDGERSGGRIWPVDECRRRSSNSTDVLLLCFAALLGPVKPGK